MCTYQSVQPTNNNYIEKGVGQKVNKSLKMNIQQEIGHIKKGED